ncbi:MAG: hypothetical protein ACD_58C00297G0012 [uncultured bacterium]|nr:MAG: hypothetical protein ACD_58C00297G0012 [uncultured bacterium]
MYQEAVRSKLISFLQSLAKIKEINNFYLAGGTSLALQIGHRESIDLDFFSYKKFSNKSLKSVLEQIGKLQIITDEPNTLNLTIDRIKLSFFYYPYKLILPTLRFKGINIADKRDIAAMKLEAIAGRGSKKDFIDIYYLCQKYSLEKILAWYKKRYKNLSINQFHLIKSLTYFVDAENDPIPKMLKPVNWTQVKEEIIKEVKKLV